MLKTKTPLISGGGIYKIYTLDPYRDILVPQIHLPEDLKNIQQC